MTKLTKTKRTLLMTAVERADGSLLPVPDGLRLRAGILNRTLDALVKDGLAETRPDVDDASTWRTDPDKGTVGVSVTVAGRAVVAECPKDAVKGNGSRAGTSRSVPRDARPRGKLGEVLKAVSRRKGATLDELTKMTGWQPHSARAALTRLRQTGHAVELSVASGRKAYRLAVEG